MFNLFSLHRLDTVEAEVVLPQTTGRQKMLGMEILEEYLLPNTTNKIT
jgi:hypothetical protein